MTKKDVMRRAIVTGAGSGIGHATARCLVADGYEVTAIDLRNPGDVANQWIKIDLDTPTLRLPDLSPGFAVLVNAAGLPPRPGTEAKVLRVNFLALRRLTLRLLPFLDEGASIVNVASKAGANWRENIDEVRRLLEQPDTAKLDDFVAAQNIDPVRSYDLSKEAVIAWTKSVTGALLDRNIRMNCVSPAAVETPILEDFVSALGIRATQGIEMTKRAGTADEVASVIALLASPEAEWVRGCNIEADGGLTAQLEAAHVIGAPSGIPPIKG